MVDSEINKIVSGEPPQSFLKKPVFWVVVVVLFAITIFLVYFLPSLNLFTPSTDDVTPDSNQVVQSGDPRLVKKAPMGQVVEPFIGDYILAADAKITGSAENTSDKLNFRIFTTSFETEESLETLSQKYADYFKSSGDQVLINQATENQLNISALLKSGGNLDIFSVEKGPGEFVFVVYLEKPTNQNINNEE
ncbi:MAG: hypothetical protein JW740_02300 [Candidatus Zambryskibacteria bacterium]|nr:hypothetical protein [Candidatus Zambryskibacteria bacterium]